MLTNQETLALLARRAERAEGRLERLEATPAPKLSVELSSYLLQLREAEEELAAAETLLQLERERQAMLTVLLSAFPGSTNESAETPATKPPQLTVSVFKS
jgi:hypothetical protein